MEGFEDLQPKCVGGRISKMVCIRQTCTSHAFLCTDQNCSACQNEHLQCRVYPYKALTRDILKKKTEVNPDVTATVRALERMFADITKKMDQLRTQIQNQLQYYGFTKQQAELIKSIKLGQESNVKGNDTACAYKSLKKDCLGLPQFSEIKNFLDYKRQQTDFAFEGLHQILSLQIQPIKIDSKIVGSIKDFQQFFDIPIVSCQLLFRFSTSQTLDQFTEICGGDARNLLVVLRNNFGKILGAYSVGGFCTDNRFRFDAIKKSFLFSITQKQKYSAKIDRSVCAHGRQQNGPTLSYTGSDEFAIMVDGNITDNTFVIGDTYGNSIIADSQEDRERLQNQMRLKITGTQQTTFTVEDWQVFQLKFIQPYSIIFTEQRLKFFEEQYIEY